MAEPLKGSSKSGRRDDWEEDGNPAKRYRSRSSSSSFEDDSDLDHNQSNAEDEQLDIDRELRAAVAEQQLELVRSLIKSGASVNAADPKERETPLILACKQRPNTLQRKSICMDIINVLLENGATVNQKNEKGQTPLHVTNSPAIVKVLVEKGAFVDEGDLYRETPLFVACKLKRSVDLITALLDAGACINADNSWSKKTPLHVASYAVMKLLIQNGANVDQVDGDGESPLFTHCRKPDCPEDLIRCLLEQDASINLKNKRGRTPLHVACQRAATRTAELLLLKGASVNEGDNDGETPLFFAARKLACTDDIITLLLMHGALINLPNVKGKTPLHVCRASAMILIQNGASVNALDNDQETPLFAACRRQSCGEGFISTLLQHGASVNIRNKEGDTPLHVAISFLRMDVVSVLLSNGAAVNEVNNKRESPLFAAASKRSCPEEMIIKLLDWGASTDMKNWAGQTPLYVACLSKATNPAMVLLRKGASVNELNNKQESPLFTAIRRMECCDNLITALLDNGASVNVQTTEGVTLLHLACQKRRALARKYPNLDLVEILLQKGAIVNGIDENDQTPLEIACKMLPSDPGLVRSLLENGATVNRRNAQGQTPLHIACSTNRTKVMCLLLLEHGASVNSTDDKGHTPLELASYACAEYLVGYGASHCAGWECREPACRFSSKHSVISPFILKLSDVGFYDPNKNLLRKIGQSNVTYYDLLFLKVPRPDIEEVLATAPEHLDTISPTYKNMLHSSYLKIKRFQRMDECISVFNLTPFPVLAPELVYKVFSYLDFGDLTALLQVVNAAQKPRT